MNNTALLHFFTVHDKMQIIHKLILIITELILFTYVLLCMLL